jgi:hypothetical protein
MGFTTKHVQELVRDAVQGQLDIPEFQRGFVWLPDQVKALVDSLYREYPIGQALIWNPPEFASARGPVGTQSPKFWIVDGQQRTTAFCLILGRKPYWWHDSDDWNLLLAKYDVLANLESNPTTVEFALPNPVRRNEPRWISVREIVSIEPTRDKTEVERKLTSIATKAIEKMGKDPRDADIVARVQSMLRSIWSIRDRELTVVDIAHEIEDVAEIFARLNRQGTEVTEADVFLSLISSLHPGWVREVFLPYQRDLKDRGFDLGPGIFIRTLTGISAGNTSLGEVKRDFWKDAAFETGWKRTAEALKHVIRGLMDRGILSSDLLPSKNALIPFCVLYDSFRESDFDFSNGLFWLILASWDGRYGGSAQTVLNQDIRAIREAKSFPEAISSLVSKLQTRPHVRPEDFKTPYTQDKSLLLLLYLSIFNRGAKDWLSTVRVGYDNSTDALNEGFSPHWHHFFPRGRRVLRAASFDYADEEINSLANITVLNQRTNQTMGSKPPEVYIPFFKIPETYLRQQFIPFEKDLWKAQNYRKFLDARASLLATAATEFLRELQGPAKEGEAPAPVAETAETPGRAPAGIVETYSPTAWGHAALEQILEVVREMKRGKSYAEACSSVAKRRRIRVQAPRDKTTRQLGFTGKNAKDEFLKYYESGKLASLLIERFPEAKERIESVMLQADS